MTHSDTDRPLYFTHNDPTREFAAFRLMAARSEYTCFRLVQTRFHSEDFDLQDAEVIATRIGAELNMPSSTVINYALALDLLDRLPNLKALNEQTLAVPLPYLVSVNNTILQLGTLDADFYDELDLFLFGIFTPTTQGQVLPIKRTVTKRLHRFIESLGKTLPAKESAQKRNQGYSMQRATPGNALIECELDERKAVLIDEAVRTLSRKLNISTFEAFSKLILEKVTVKVTLNTFQAADIENAPLEVENYGPLASWLEPDSVRDLSGTQSKIHPGYTPTTNQRTFMQGRDGTCMWPNCSRPASDCQTDHRINYADGGETAPHNMIMLCQHHHNKKTDKMAFYLRDEFTGIVYWLFADGTWVSNAPSGPLAPENLRWLLTLDQICQRRQTRQPI